MPSSRRALGARARIYHSPAAAKFNVAITSEVNTANVYLLVFALSRLAARPLINISGARSQIHHFAIVKYFMPARNAS
jgi:hypothetical protein